MLPDEIADALDEGVLVLDSGNHVVAANAPARAILVLRDPCIGKPVTEVIHDFRVARACESPPPATAAVHDETVDAADGRVLTLRTVALAAGGKAIVIRDQTQLRRLEKVRQDFVANISHELRTPVTAIQLIAETLLNGALDEAPVAREFVERIAEEVKQLATMIVDLLDLARMEGGADAFAMAQVNVVDVFQSLTRLDPLLTARNQSLSIDVPADLPPLLGDRRRLEQVMRNLVHNASKYSPEGTPIRVVARHRGTSLAIDVIDRGPGIPSSDERRVFERFWKADRSRQRDGEGTGLGLAIVRHVVAGHGGTVGVTAPPEGGACFTVILPLPVVRGLPTEI